MKILNSTFSIKPDKQTVKGNTVRGSKLAAIAAAASIVAAPVAGGELSGLAWNSGTACWTSAFDSWRGRPADVILEYLPWRGSWEENTRHTENRNFGAIAKRPVAVRIGLLTADTKGQLAQCAAGAFDPYMRRIGAALTRKGMGNAVIGLGWEWNHTGYPWTASNRDAYVACYRRHAATLRSSMTRPLFEWTSSKRGSMPVTIDAYYPGADVVDFIGVNYYDRCPTVRNETEWAAAYNATNKGGPFGLGQWLAYARSKGKPLSLPEWAISDDEAAGCSPVPDDNPFFIRKMFETIKANASSIGYEVYFNCGTGNYRVYPSSHNQKSSAEYLRLYKGG